jgi:hypothetical protein
MDWKALVNTVAPWIGTALGGPLGGLAVNALGSALGLDDKTEASIKQALAGVTPEQMLAIKNAEQEFQARMTELGFKNLADMEKIAADDRASARSMQVAQRSRVPAILSVIVTMGFFGLLFGMLTGHLNVSDSQALLILLGALATGWGQVMAFWFGTTHDSGRKTDMLAKAEPVK